MSASFTCPACGRTSRNPKDVEEGYCGHCHDWTADDKPADQEVAVIHRGRAFSSLEEAFEWRAQQERGPLAQLYLSHDELDALLSEVRPAVMRWEAELENSPTAHARGKVSMLSSLRTAISEAMYGLERQ